MTKATPASSEMLKRVMRISVMGSSFAPLSRLLDKERDYGTAGTHHIAITDYGEPDILGTADIVGGSKQLVGSELGGRHKD